MSSSSFSPSVLTLPATSQQLELNIVTNPTAATSPTDKWTVSGMSVTRDATGSPLDPLVPTGFNMSSTANGQTFTTVALTVPSTLMNKKLKVEFYYTYVSGTSFTLDVLDGADVHYNLTTDVSGTTTLPQTSGKFTAYFDSNNTTSLKVRFSSTGTGVTKFTQLIVGPGIQPQGAALQEWQTYTPTISAGFGSSTNINFRFRRVGDSVEIEGSFTCGTVATSAGFFSLPNNLTIDTTKIPNISAVTNLQGHWFSSGGTSAALMSNNRGGAIAASSSDTSNLYVAVRSSTAALILDNVSGQICSSGDSLFIRAVAPIAQWSGSGTVNIAQNDVEYASNSSTTDADDTTSFAYGPSGSVIPTISPAAATSGRSKRVQFQRPIQNSDEIVIEIQDSGTGPWIPIGLAQNYPVRSYQNAAGTTYWYSMAWVGVNSTQIDITFGRAGRGTTGTGYGVTGSSYPANAADRWRVRKSSAGSAVGFGIVQPGTSAGLVSASGLPGNTTGNSIATGYVGEKIESSSTSNLSQSTPVSGTWYYLSGMPSVTLTSGVWLLVANQTVEALGTFSPNVGALKARIYNTTDSVQVNQSLATSSQNANFIASCLINSVVVVPAVTSKTYRIEIQGLNWSGTPTWTTLFSRGDSTGGISNLLAVRIA